MNAHICPIAKLERLLLATDGSQYSEAAIREALNLARKCSSKLIAVSVVITNLEFEVTMPQVVEKEEKKAREHLEAIKARASKEDVDCDITAIHGDEPYQDIVRQALKNRVDMIIVGRHGRTGLLRLMMGSVAAKVIGHAPHQQSQFCKTKKQDKDDQQGGTNNSRPTMFLRNNQSRNSDRVLREKLRVLLPDAAPYQDREAGQKNQQHEGSENEGKALPPDSVC